MAYPPPPYKDAVAGTFVAGEAIAGTWWAYPSQSQLGLQGIPPGIVVVNADTDITLTPPTALLGLKGTLPTLAITSTLAVPQTLLGLLAGSASIVFAGQRLLVASLPSELELVAAVCVDSDALSATVCEDEFLQATKVEVG